MARMPKRPQMVRAAQSIYPTGLGEAALEYCKNRPKPRAKTMGEGGDQPAIKTDRMASATTISKAAAMA